MAAVGSLASLPHTHLDVRTRAMIGVFAATMAVALSFAIFARTALPLATMVLFQAIAATALATIFDAFSGVPGHHTVRLQRWMPVFAGLAFTMPVFLFARYEYAPGLAVWPFLAAEVLALVGLSGIAFGAWRLRLALARQAGPLPRPLA